MSKAVRPFSINQLSEKGMNGAELCKTRANLASTAGLVKMRGCNF